MFVYWLCTAKLSIHVLLTICATYIGCGPRICNFRWHSIPVFVNAFGSLLATMMMTTATYKPSVWQQNRPQITECIRNIRTLHTHRQTRAHYRTTNYPRGIQKTEGKKNCVRKFIANIAAIE